MLEFEGEVITPHCFSLKIPGYSRKVIYLAKILSTMPGAQTLTKKPKASGPLLIQQKR